ncbi:MAG: hypothetical protein HDS71_09315 [Bacteroidales bacterium]|nr:hypothetical protein [Bacteroidales bacterium]
MKRNELLNKINAIVGSLPKFFEIQQGQNFISVVVFGYMANGERYCAGWHNFRASDTENTTLARLETLRKSARCRATF